MSYPHAVATGNAVIATALEFVEMTDKIVDGQANLGDHMRASQAFLRAVAAHREAVAREQT